MGLGQHGPGAHLVPHSPGLGLGLRATRALRKRHLEGVDEGAGELGLGGLGPCFFFFALFWWGWRKSQEKKAKRKVTICGWCCGSGSSEKKVFCDVFVGFDACSLHVPGYS